MCTGLLLSLALTVQYTVSTVESGCIECAASLYPSEVPQLWSRTVETHRRDVRAAILDSAVELVAQQGLRPVTMALVAERAGIGRATLYKYFSDLEAILVAWHQEHVDAHLEQLAAVRDQINDPMERLEAVLCGFARILSMTGRRSHGAELTALLHRDAGVMKAGERLHRLLVDLLTDAIAVGRVRADCPVDELADFCLGALSSARKLTSDPAVDRLVSLTLSCLSV